jgi:hypothetical protein
MNYIDITKNSSTHCVKHRVVKIVNREGIQGPPGKDGITPTINPENGHWMLGVIDTGVQALGLPGHTPYINAEGYWCIDGESTGVLATGLQGIPGNDGYTPYIDNETYHWFINGEDTGVSAIGRDGETPRVQDGFWWIGDINTGYEVLTREIVPEILPFDSYLCFPVIGNAKNLYIDTSTNECFRWTGDSYARFETPYDFIDCGGASDYSIPQTQPEQQSSGCNCNCNCHCHG